MEQDATEEELAKELARKVLLEQHPDAEWTEVWATQKGNSPVYDVAFLNYPNYYLVQVEVH